MTVTNRPAVMIADDDPAIADAVAIVLQDDGYTVTTVVSGDIVAEMRCRKPDLLFLDVRISGQDGREVCRVLKDDETTRRTPIVLLSAHADLAAIAAEAGADDYLAKPFDLDDLLAKVAAHTGR